MDLEGAGRPLVNPGAWAPKWINDTLRPLEGLGDPDGPVLTDIISLHYVHASVFMLGSDGIILELWTVRVWNVLPHMSASITPHASHQISRSSSWSWVVDFVIHLRIWYSAPPPTSLLHDACDLRLFCSHRGGGSVI